MYQFSTASKPDKSNTSSLILKVCKVWMEPAVTSDELPCPYMNGNNSALPDPSMEPAVTSDELPCPHINGNNSAVPDPSVSSSEGDRLCESIEAWKQTAALASERYAEARQRQLVNERRDREELRKRWLDAQENKRSRKTGKRKKIVNEPESSANISPSLQQSTPVHCHDGQRHRDSNVGGHEEWRQGFRLSEDRGAPNIPRESSVAYINYPQSGTIFSPGMMMPVVQQQSSIGMVPSFPVEYFPRSATYPVDPYSANDEMSSSRRGQFISMEKTPDSSAFVSSAMSSTFAVDLSLGRGYPSMELQQFVPSYDCVSAGLLQSQQAECSAFDPIPYGCDGRHNPSIYPT
ncbi:hypothetical protein KIN20_011935 [Parelaphostrongylus tenuis]|uniref:Uncharacterized protein n=1 Tax=Parelaphostrongylus tenuis TaxID=148309 RepID=A0AAD5QMH0_PARTN|nr:hypothetical protein KIN20_011935 [Parelaphostrongylus tenuis]